MRPDVQARLAALNRDFYAAHGEAFADARPRLAVGAQRVLEQIPAGAAVLEAGCGDGKVGRWLAAHRPGGRYLGLEASDALLERARRYTAQWLADAGQPYDAPRPPTQTPLLFLKADLLAPDLDPALSAQRFEWALAFAVFHHLPGAATRARVLQALADRLLPGGWLAFSNWQFWRSPRLRGRVRPWSALGLDPADVEAGDHLLAWERRGLTGLRYVHRLEEAEARGLAASAGLAVKEVFSADGVTGNLAEYVVAQKPAG